MPSIEECVEYVKPDSEDGPYIFVSYSHEDDEYVQQILRWLKKSGYRFWYDRGISPGANWATEIWRHIEHCEQFLLIITPNSVKSSDVSRELGIADNYGKTKIVVQLTTLFDDMGYRLYGIQTIRATYSKIPKYELISVLAKTTLKPHSEERTVLSQSFADVPNQFLAFGQAVHHMGYQGASFFLRYKILEKIGEGGVSEVYAAEDVKTGSRVIVKKAKKRGEYYTNAFVSEKNTLLTLTKRKCPFTPALLDWYEFEDELLLVESLVPGLPLSKIVHFSVGEVMQIALEILSFLHYLHSLSILHLDIKPSNIFVDTRPPYNILSLIDFNLSKVADKSGISHAGGYTRYYAPPEQLRRIYDDLNDPWMEKMMPDHHLSKPVSFSSDLYSLGITLKVLLLKGAANVRAIREYQCPVRYFRQDVSPELEQILRKMTLDNPNKRYQTAEEAIDALNHCNSLSTEEKLVACQQSNQELTCFQERIEAIRKSSQEFRTFYSVNPDISLTQTFFSPPTYLSGVVLNEELPLEVDHSVDLDSD